jgi:hypothetical protein
MRYFEPLRSHTDPVNFQKTTTKWNLYFRKLFLFECNCVWGKRNDEILDMKDETAILKIAYLLNIK